KLEINPADLSVYYAIDSVTFDTAGIYNIIVDSVSNRIFAQVSHFSALVVREKGSVVHVKQENNTGSSIPKDYALLQNYPNPFNPVTNIFYNLPEKSPVVLKVYNVLGEEIKILVNKVQEAGTKMAIWDATDNSGKPVTSGIYFYQIIAGYFNQTKKMILLR
ncbi:MAG: T9SS type A sorting domain-containing protein, partial [bacterium]